MVRFLHVADIHLGFDRYDSQIRSQDFFKAFYDVLARYAVEPAVDFVLIAGDLFEHRNIRPATLNQAQVCLNLLADASIPAIAIEGNHDNRPYGTKTSWLRYLADWGSLIFLEPEAEDDGSLTLSAWDATQRFGGYIDLDCGVRIIGTHWYGAVAPTVIEQMGQSIQALPQGPDRTIVLFHHGLEGHVSRYAGALRYEELLPLRRAGVDYLALGHIHKSYAVENWVFNPGSLEANSVEESKYDRGAYSVTMGPTSVDAQLCTDYYQRALVRLHLKIKGSEVVEDVETSAQLMVEQAIADKQLVPEDEPIVELRITGRVGFERSDLDTRTLRQRLKELSNALIFLLRYDVDTVAYQSPWREEDDQLQIESDVYTDLIAGHAQYKQQAQYLSQGLCQLKDLYLQHRSELELYQSVGKMIAGIKANVEKTSPDTKVNPSSK